MIEPSEQEQYDSLKGRLENEVSRLQCVMKEAFNKADMKNVELCRALICTHRRYLRELRKPGEPRR